MLGFIKKLFGTKPVETVEAVPYKVEVATPVVEEVKAAPAPTPAKAPKKPAVKKTGGSKPKGARKPKAKPAVK